MQKTSKIKLELDILLGNNLDKIKAIPRLNASQIEKIVHELFSREEPLKFSDYEMNKKKLGTSRTFKVTGALVLEKLLATDHYPESYAKMLAQFLHQEQMLGTRLGYLFVKKMTRFPQAMDWLVTQGIRTGPSSQFFISVNFFKTHEELILRYQNQYFKIMKSETKNLNQLVRLTQSFLELLNYADQQLILPSLQKTIKQITRKIPQQAMKEFQPELTYIDTVVIDEQSLAEQLISQEISTIRKKNKRLVLIFKQEFYNPDFRTFIYS